jgi:hypothetical protein
MVAIDLEIVLRGTGYRTRLSPYDPNILLFEDDAIFGFVALFDTPAQLLSLWRDKQALFIRKNAEALRRGSMKSWNCYAVFLCSGIAEEADRRIMAEVEEDLALTRKLVADGVTTLRDVQQALLPILPIQNHSAPSEETTLDLSARLDTWPTQAIRALEGKATAAELIEILWDNQ